MDLSIADDEKSEGGGRRKHGKNGGGKNVWWRSMGYEPTRIGENPPHRRATHDIRVLLIRVD